MAFYSKNPNINTPILIIIIVKYCALVSFSFNKILPNITATILSIDINGAATTELEFRAYT